MPVLPAVPSMMTPPGFNWPAFSASRMIQSAARSFTDCPGLRNSALPRIVQPVASETVFSRIRGVLPIASRTDGRMAICRTSCLRTAAEAGRVTEERRRAAGER
ncbi:hypothetical protein D9M69_582470 [compost metagenome]